MASTDAAPPAASSADYALPAGLTFTARNSNPMQFFGIPNSGFAPRVVNPKIVHNPSPGSINRNELFFRRPDNSLGIFYKQPSYMGDLAGLAAARGQEGPRGTTASWEEFMSGNSGGQGNGHFINLSFFPAKKITHNPNMKSHHRMLTYAAIYSSFPLAYSPESNAKYAQTSNIEGAPVLHHMPTYRTLTLSGERGQFFSNATTPNSVQVDIALLADDHSRLSVIASLENSCPYPNSYITFTPVLTDSQALDQNGAFYIDGAFTKGLTISGASLGSAVFAAVQGYFPCHRTGYLKYIAPKVTLDRSLQQRMDMESAGYGATWPSTDGQLSYVTGDDGNPIPGIIRTLGQDNIVSAVSDVIEKIAYCVIQRAPIVVPGIGDLGENMATYINNEANKDSFVWLRLMTRCYSTAYAQDRVSFMSNNGAGGWDTPLLMMASTFTDCQTLQSYIGFAAFTANTTYTLAPGQDAQGQLASSGINTYLASTDRKYQERQVQFDLLKDMRQKGDSEGIIRVKAEAAAKKNARDAEAKKNKEDKSAARKKITDTSKSRKNEKTKASAAKRESRLIAKAAFNKDKDYQKFYSADMAAQAKFATAMEKLDQDFRAPAKRNIASYGNVYGDNPMYTEAQKFIDKRAMAGMNSKARRLRGTTDINDQDLYGRAFDSMFSPSGGLSSPENQDGANLSQFTTQDNTQMSQPSEFNEFDDSQSESADVRALNALTGGRGRGRGSAPATQSGPLGSGGFGEPVVRPGASSKANTGTGAGRGSGRGRGTG